MDKKSCTNCIHCDVCHFRRENGWKLVELLAELKGYYSGTFGELGAKYQPIVFRRMAKACVYYKRVEVKNV
jgi:hypothetical protein